jgi:nucleotide-binding universal stress UspA family protein
MLKLIIVPLDGTEFAEQALPLAITVAERQRAAIELVHVYETLLPFQTQGAPALDPTLDLDLRRDRQAYLQRIAQWLRETTTAPVTALLLEGEEAAPVIREHIAQRHADLVVMATHGRSGLSRFWVGTTSLDVMRHSPAPVLLFRPDEKGSKTQPTRAFGRVLIPLDGAPADEEAIDHAIAVAGDRNVEFLLLQVIVPIAYYAEPVSAALLEDIELDEVARTYLEEVAGRIRARGLSVTTEVLHHPSPARAVLDVADEHGVDLIAMETHGRTGVAKLLLGSVTDKVVRAAAVPVLVHRTPVRNDEHAGESSEAGRSGASTRR